jgi:hypothetical protein
VDAPESRVKRQQEKGLGHTRLGACGVSCEQPPSLAELF